MLVISMRQEKIVFLNIFVYSCSGQNFPNDRPYDANLKRTLKKKPRTDIGKTPEQIAYLTAKALIADRLLVTAKE